MREDMGKVLVERPRLKPWKYRTGPEKGYRKQARRGLDAGESPPIREGIKRRYGTRTKQFNEHLGPLRRFLDSNVGRPWDKVYAEICKHVDRGNVVQKHILTHLFEYVVTHVVLIDGEPCFGKHHHDFRGEYGMSVRTSHREHRWYVCPKSGLLRKSRYTPWRPERAEPPRGVALNKTQMCLLLKGQCEMVTVAPVPVEYQQRVYDVVRRRQLWGDPRGNADAVTFYGANVYATARRPLTRDEIRALPIPIEWVK